MSSTVQVPETLTTTAERMAYAQGLDDGARFVRERLALRLLEISDEWAGSSVHGADRHATVAATLRMLAVPLVANGQPAPIPGATAGTAVVS